MEAEAAGATLDSPAQRVLIEHLDLIRTQTQLGRLQIASERAGLALKWMTCAAALAAAAALALVAWQARQARGLVFEPFSTPPDLAQQGVTGEVVAAQVLDRLAEMRAATSTTRRTESMTNDWGRDIKLAIPSTGLTLDDVQGALRQWLGRETRVTGELYRTKAEEVLAVRLAGRPAFIARGDVGNLAALANQAAEAILRDTQPYRYSVWLGQNGRGEEELPFLQFTARNHPDAIERAWAWRGIARALGVQGDWIGAKKASEEAIKLRPGLSVAWQTLGNSEFSLGHTEAFGAARRKSIKLMANDPDLDRWARNPAVEEAGLALESGDIATARAKLAEIEADPRRLRSLGVQVPILRARLLCAAHELSAARIAHEAERQPDTSTDTMTAWTLLNASEAWPEMLRVASDPNLVGRERLFGSTPQAQRISIGSIQLAQAKMMTGDMEGAAAILDDTPLDCDRCLISRGQLAALKGDPAAADRWFTLAVGSMPSFPRAAYEWGRVKLSRGDPRGAAALFRHAKSTGPRWADPLEGEGEALLALGDSKGAAKRFAKAAALAPRWGRLHLKWGEALAAQGRVGEARARWRAAAEMDLTPAERARVEALLVGRRA
jgi:tetratricopeptide (TPR) repeat protein